jgi:RNA polymerase sigma-70 factor (ECF subfamily)
MERVERWWAGRPGPAWTVTVAHADTPEAVAPLRDLDDAALVAACVSGQREAFDVIVERHRRAVYRLCHRFVGTHEDASDLAQEVFLRAYRGLGKFKGDAAFGTWIYRIGVNACLNRVSVRKPTVESLQASETLAAAGPDPMTSLLQREQAIQVRAAIAKLPPKQRATLVLRVYHDLPHQEIAGILGSSVGAVKANFFHALQNLKRILAEQKAG